jgi:hypothetical protein
MIDLLDYKSTKYELRLYEFRCECLVITINFMIVLFGFLRGVILRRPKNLILKAIFVFFIK